MKPNATFLLLGVLGLCACAGGEKDAGVLPAQEVLTADSLGVHEIFRPHKFFPLGDRMVVQTLEDTVFYVYGLPDFDFRYAQGPRGEGPDEFLSPIAMPTGGEDVFSVRTYRGGQRTMELYRALDTALVKVGSFRDWGFDPNYQMACVVVEDSLLVGAFIEDSPQKRHVLRLVDLRSGEVLDSLTDFYEYTLPFDGRENMGRNTAWVAASGSRLAIAYQETQTLALYEIKDGRFRQVASLGDAPAPERESFDPDPSHSRVSYVALFADSDRVYAVNAHTDVAALVRGEDRDVVVEVYDWTGRGLGAYRFDRKNLWVVGVDGKRKTIYAIDPRQDFDRIYACGFRRGSRRGQANPPGVSPRGFRLPASTEGSFPVR